MAASAMLLLLQLSLFFSVVAMAMPMPMHCHAFVVDTTTATGRTRTLSSSMKLASTAAGSDGNNRFETSVNDADADADAPAQSQENPWAQAKWKFVLNLGRERGTYMPKEWGASGGRLAVPFEVTVSPDRPSRDANKQDPMLQRNTFEMIPQSEPATYITMDGEKEVFFGRTGEWKIRLPTGRAKGHAAKLMCYVDLESRIEKNDIVLDRGERIYLTAKCWREEELERAVALIQPIARKYREKQQRLEEAVEHASGDRRLDGTDPIQTLMGMKDTAQLVMSRDEARDEYEEALRVYPSNIRWENSGSVSEPIGLSVDDLPIDEGPWPGQVEWLSIEPLYAMVRRTKLFAAEEYHVIGTWSATPVFPDEDDTDDV